MVAIWKALGYLEGHILRRQPTAHPKMREAIVAFMVTTERIPSIMDFKEIKRIVELVSQHELTDFELDHQGVRLMIRRQKPEAAQPVYMPAPSAHFQTMPHGAPSAHTGSAPTPAPLEADDSDLEEITSPMVGTFYRSPNPESPPFVKVGDKVGPDTVVCIIEAMKVMNEIKAEASGVIKQVMLESGDSVEYGQPLFKIEPA